MTIQIEDTFIPRTLVITAGSYTVFDLRSIPEPYDAVFRTQAFLPFLSVGYVHLIVCILNLMVSYGTFIAPLVSPSLITVEFSNSADHVCHCHHCDFNFHHQRRNIQQLTNNCTMSIVAHRAVQHQADCLQTRSCRPDHCCISHPGNYDGPVIPNHLLWSKVLFYLNGFLALPEGYFCFLSFLLQMNSPRKRLIYKH